MFDIADCTTDPLALLIAREEGDELEAEVMESSYLAAMNRTKTSEREREQVDLLGASPAEFEAQFFDE